MQAGWRRFTYGWALSVMLLALSAHAATGVSLGGAADQSVTVVDADFVRERALHAFDATTARRVDRMLERGTVSRDDLLAAAEPIRKAYADEVDITLQDLEGDGLLEVSEVSNQLGEVRDEMLRELTLTFQAVEHGHPPPPIQRQFDSAWRYAASIVHYTFVVRNGWIDWAWFALYLAGGLLVGWLANRVLCWLGARLDASSSPTAARTVRTLRGPAYLTAAVTGIYLSLDALWVPGIAQPVLDKVLQVGITSAAFWAAWGLARGAAAAIANLSGRAFGRSVDHHIELLLLRVLRVLVMIGFLIALVNLIVESSLAGLLTGLGVIGVALSFVLRGSIENIAAAFTLFGDKPIRVGDLMEYDDQWGVIEDIGFRATRFRTFDGFVIHIPNAEIISEAIHNISARSSIRRRFRLGLIYGTPPDKVKEAMDILNDILSDYEGKPADQPPRVVFETYGDYDLKLLVQYYFSPPDYWKAMDFDSEVNLQILERFNAAGIEFAFPTQTTVLSTDPDDQPVIGWHRLDAEPVDDDTRTTSPSESKGDAEVHEKSNGEPSGASR